MNIAILSNRQGEGIAAALRLLLPDSTVTHLFCENAPVAPEAAAAIAARLAQHSHVVSQLNHPGLGALAPAELRRALPHAVTLPLFEFRGFHPDTLRIRAGESELQGPTGAYHSRLAIAGFLAGLEPDETAALYHELAFARLGYFAAFAAECEALLASFLRHGLNAAPMLERLRAQGCFMHGIDTPKPAAMLELARACCALFGLPAPAAPETPPDVFAGGAAHPVLPEIAAAIGIAPEGAFRPQGAGAGADLTLADFTAASFAAYRQADRAALRGAGGVAEALAALGLAELSPRGAAPPREPNMMLMTWHGTLLRPEAGSADAALHLPINAPDIDTEALRVDLAPAPALAAPASLDLFGGVTLRPAAHPGTVALARDTAYLTADRDSARAWFARDAVGDWESFLPVSDSQLDTLRTLLAGAWAEDGAASAKTPRLAGGPALLFGAGRIDLAGAWPRPLPSLADGAARLLVLLDGAPAILRQAAAPPPRHAANVVALGQSMVITGASVNLPAPLTLGNAARRWLHDACGEADGLPWRHETPHLVLQREADQALRSPGAAGPGPVTLPGPLAVVSPSSQPSPHWAGPLLRLLAMAPHLPPGAAVIAPLGEGAGPALAEAWRALGLKPMQVIEPPPGLYTAADVTWLHPLSPGQWPAERLHAVRAAVLRGTPPERGRYFLRGPAAGAIANLAAVETSLAELDVTVIDCATTPPAAQLAALRSAGALIGVGEDLLAAAFCPPGAKIIEITSDRAFNPEAWHLSCRLGFSHAVLPCPETETGLQVNRKQLVGLSVTLRFRLS